MPLSRKGHQSLKPFGLALLSAAVSVAGTAPPIGPFIATNVGCGRGICCVLSIDGFVKCWGSHSDTGSAELGFVDLGGHVETAWFQGLYGSFMVKLTDGRLVGWGLGKQTNAKSIWEVMSLGVGCSLVELSVGEQFTCFILDNDEVKCVGKGNMNPLQSAFDPSTRSLDEMPAIDFGGRIPVEIAASRGSCCVRFTDGSVSCFGSNSGGECGMGRTGSIPPVGSLPPINLGASRTCELLAAGHEFFCCVLDGGGVVCWGGNWMGHPASCWSCGPLGTGDRLDRGDEPHEMGENLTEFHFPSAVTKLSLGHWHSCAIYGTDIQCWGEGNKGRLLNGGNEDQDSPPTAPVALPSGRIPVGIAAGEHYTAALFDDGSVKIAGSDYLPMGTGSRKSIGDSTPFLDLGFNGTTTTTMTSTTTRSSTTATTTTTTTTTKTKKCGMVPAPVALMFKAKRCL